MLFAGVRLRPSFPVSCFQVHNTLLSRAVALLNDRPGSSSLPSNPTPACFDQHLPGIWHLSPDHVSFQDASDGLRLSKGEVSNVHVVTRRLKKKIPTDKHQLSRSHGSSCSSDLPSPSITNPTVSSLSPSGAMLPAWRVCQALSLLPQVCLNLSRRVDPKTDRSM